MRFDTVLIDIDDTLFDFRKSSYQALVKAFSEIGFSFGEQEKLYSEKLSEYLANPDYTEVRAQAAVQKHVPKGGCSEAQTGLLIGFVMTDEKTVAFIERECINYGFVQRYTKDKEDITKMSENETLYRYVGIDNAKKMRSFNMSLEEYSEYVSLQKNQE